MTSAARPAPGLPVNDAPYTTLLYEDPKTGKRVRTRITPEIAGLRLERCGPIRAFPRYKGRRAHQGRYWFSRSQTYVKFESRFEMTALMWLDFTGQATAVSSNPFWLLWPKGSAPKRHAPDFFVRRRNGSALVVDVKPAERITDQDRAQHAQTRAVCDELGWEYEEFTAIGSAAYFNLRLLCGYHHPRFAPSARLEAAIESRLGKAGEQGVRLSLLVDMICKLTAVPHDLVLSGLYHMLWNGPARIDISRPLSWDSTVRP